MPKKSEMKTEKVKKEKEPSVKLSDKEFDSKVLEMAKSGLTAEKIGESLRKQNIHPKEHSKKISRVLKENNAYVNPDLKNVEEKMKKIQTHYDKNHQDKRAMREKDRVLSQLRTLKNYYKA